MKFKNEMEERSYLDETLDKILLADEEYIQMNRKEEACITRLKATGLTEEQFQIIDELCSCLNAAGSIYGWHAYLLGKIQLNL